jgi:hypothetical protein
VSLKNGARKITGQRVNEQRIVDVRSSIWRIAMSVEPFTQESVDAVSDVVLEFRKRLAEVQAIKLKHFANIQPRNLTGSALDLESAFWNIRRAIKLLETVEQNEVRRLNDPAWQPEFI